MTWPSVALGQVAEINPREATRPADSEEIAFVPMAELDATRATTSRGAVRTFAEVSKGYTIFRDADVLVAKITPCFENNKIGQAHLSRPTGVGSTEFHVVRPRDSALDPRYVLHFLRQDRIRAQGERRMTGSAGQRRVPAAFLAGLEIPLPPLAEQRRISAILDKADALRAQRKQTSAYLDHFTSSLFYEMFGDPDAAIAAGATSRFDDVVATLEGGRSLVADDPTADTHNRVLKISSVTSGRFLASESKPLPDDYVPPPNHFVRAGDLLISRANTTDLVGATAYVASAPQNLVLPDKLWRFVWRNPGNVEPLFMRALFQTPAMRRQISSRSSGTGGSMKNISKAKLHTMPLPMPSYPDQVAFVAKLRTVEMAHVQVRVAKESLDNLFASLQSRAFAGEL